MEGVITLEAKRQTTTILVRADMLICRKICRIKLLAKEKSRVAVIEKSYETDREN